MGDTETPVENILTGILILKVGHHGSTSSSSQAFLNKVDPEVAIISVGTGNTYGHPAQETLMKLESMGVNVCRTDLNGNIVVSTDGNSYTVSVNGVITLEFGTELPIIKPAGTPPPLPVTSQGEYVGSINSNKYHYPDCRYANQIE